MPVNLTTPVGRLVGGSLYTPQPKKDNKGQPKLGADGQPLTGYWFHLAIPKGAERHWAETAWGAQIWQEGHRGHPTFAPHPTFAWKVEDGDSRVPNKKGKMNADMEGMPGHWILKFSSGFAVRIFNADGSQQIMEKDAVKLGYYVQVNLDCAPNTGDSPGVYLNPKMVALSAYGPEISFGPDPASAGFGQAPLPAGASVTPPAGGFNPAPLAPAPAAAVPLPTMPAVPGPAIGAPPALPSSPPPNPAFLQVPAAPPAAPVRQMTAKAAGATYEQLIGAGWNDVLLLQHGMMLA